MNDFSRETPKSPEIEKKPLRIIHIEDQKDFRNLVEEQLERFSVDVELVASFSSTEEAKEYLMRLKDEEKELPDVIVSDNDLGIGKATGIEFAKDLKKLEFEIPIVLFTGGAKDLKGISEERLNEMGLTKVVDNLESVKSLVGILKAISLSSNMPQNKPQ